MSFPQLRSSGPFDFVVGGGPQTFFHSMAATLSFSGANNCFTGHGMSSSCGLSGSFTKFTSKAPFTGTLSFVGEIVKQVGKSLTGTLSFSGTLTKSIGKSLSGALSFTGEIIKLTSHLLAGTCDFSGELNKSRPVGLSATLNFTGAVTKSIGKNLTGGLSFTGAITKLVGKILQGTLTCSGSESKSTTHGNSATLSFTGVLTVSRLFLQALTATLNFAGALVTVYQPFVPAAFIEWIVRMHRRARRTAYK